LGQRSAVVTVPTCKEYGGVREEIVAEGYEIN
jgi:hypothetical protein